MTYPLAYPYPTMPAGPPAGGWQSAPQPLSPPSPSYGPAPTTWGMPVVSPPYGYAPPASYPVPYWGPAPTAPLPQAPPIKPTVILPPPVIEPDPPAKTTEPDAAAPPAEATPPSPEAEPEVSRPTPPRPREASPTPPALAEPVTEAEKTGRKIGQWVTQLLEENPQLQSKLEALNPDALLAQLDGEHLQGMLNDLKQKVQQSWLLRQGLNYLEKPIMNLFPPQYQPIAERVIQWLRSKQGAGLDSAGAAPF